MIRKKRNDKVNDFRTTLENNVSEAMLNQRVKTQTENEIKKLEEEEMRMLSRMKDTLAQKQAAFKTLQSKAPALKRGIEPRNAYRKKSSVGVIETQSPATALVDPEAAAAEAE